MIYIELTGKLARHIYLTARVHYPSIFMTPGDNIDCENTLQNKYIDVLDSNDSG